MWPLYKKGDVDANVWVIETKLRDLGFFEGFPDEVFDEKTEEAVKAFQSAMGLKVDGIVGPQTWGALFGKKVKEEYTKPPPTDKKRWVIIGLLLGIGTMLLWRAHA